MSATAPEPIAPLGEPMMAARRDRLVRLARMVFELMKERYFRVTIHDYDATEEVGLIEALRVCSRHVEQIGCLNFDEELVIQVEGIDGHDYIIRFSLHDPGFRLIASRVGIRTLEMREGDESAPSLTMSTMDVLQEYREQIRPGRVSADRAFLIGMAALIGFMDLPADDEGEALMPLAEWITPRRAKLRSLRPKLPPPTIDYDDEGEQPF